MLASLYFKDIARPVIFGGKYEIYACFYEDKKLISNRSTMISSFNVRENYKNSPIILCDALEGFIHHKVNEIITFGFYKHEQKLYEISSMDIIKEFIRTLKQPQEVKIITYSMNKVLKDYKYQPSLNNNPDYDIAQTLAYYHFNKKSKQTEFTE